MDLADFTLRMPFGIMRFMNENTKVEYRRLKATDLDWARQLNEMFADAFEDQESYASRKPGDSYLATLLSKDHIVVLVALEQGLVVGGLVAYMLEKFEQARSEAYIYDLAVKESCRRRGIATQLITKLKSVAKALGAWVIFVQADRSDPPAIKLYESLGIREEPLHFDISVD